MELPIIKRLKRDLEELYHELNVRIPRDLQEAAAHGDLSENAEYEAARARQDFVRARIAQLEERMRQLSLYNLSSIPRDVVAYGSRVKLEDVDEGQIIEYHIVFPEEVDPAAGHISLHSPIGQALLRKAVGDEVEVVTPQGKRTYQLVELLTLHDLAEEAES
ncbi:MAG TPA: transcription elongation factor GreA [Methylomirabilota bacterium]|jgi:transcription elongation factor GreA|nr:transcription elongation factor GreA [Methylomirabilota bacterium]